MGAVQLGREATHGTIASALVSAAVNFGSELDHMAKINEEQRNGQDQHFNVIPGRKHQKFNVADSPVYHDTLGYFLESAMGLPVSSQVATEGIYDSVFKLLDDPVSLSMQWTQARRSTQGYQSLYSVVDKLTIKFSAAGDLSFSCSGVGMPETDITAPTFAFSTVRPFSEWTGAVTLGGGTYADLLSGSVTITRGRKPFFTIANTQSPAKMSISRRMVDFDLKVDFTSKAQYDKFKAATTDALTIDFIDTGIVIGSGTNNPKLTVKLGTVAYENGGKIDDKPDFPELALKGKALYNVADASKVVATLRSTRQYQTA